MVWTPPTTRANGNLITATIWNTDLTDNLSFLGVSHDHSGDSGDGGNVTRGMFIAPAAVNGGGAVLSSTIDTVFPAATLPDGSATDVIFGFRIPANFQAADKLVIILNPQATGDIVRDGLIGYAADGQANSTHLDSLTITTVSLVDNTFKEDSILGDWDSEAALDIVGIQYRRDGSDSADLFTSALHIHGLYFEWH